MSDRAAATVYSLWKRDVGYEVEVSVHTDGPSFKLEIQTSFDDPKEAIEAARKWLYGLGISMTKAMDNPGSLK